MESYDARTGEMNSPCASVSLPVKPETRNTEVFRIENLTFTYPNRDTAALSDITLSIGRGEFITLCGPSGCGKTTFLRQLKPAAVPHGVKSGEVYFRDTPLSDLPARDAAAKIGFVMQSPDNQIVTDKVWHELAFGLESLGLKTPEIRLRVAEMASFFGIQTWFHKSVTELSGGQKQMLALASIMALQPSALILDEPTSQLDPIAAGEFLATVGKINRELGVTVILTEHRLEEAFPLSSRAIVMDSGRVIADGLPRDVGLALRGRSRAMSAEQPALVDQPISAEQPALVDQPISAEQPAHAEQPLTAEHPMFRAMPTAMRVWAACTHGAATPAAMRVGAAVDAGAGGHGPEAGDQGPGAGEWRQEVRDRGDEKCPITVRDGADWLAKISEGGVLNVSPLTNEKPARNAHPLSPAVELDGLWFKYEKNMPDVIKGLSFKANYGEITVILGGNGTGKTTALSLIAGLNTPHRGKVRVKDQVLTLPQNPQSLFVAKTVREDLLEMLSSERRRSGEKLTRDEKNRRLAVMVKLCRLDGLLDSHPYDLSGGEQQRAALAKVLLLRPKILLLDEPTKGLDAEYKQIFAAILNKLTEVGVAVVMASHDVEFCAEYADRCALFFDGNIVTENAPRAFFSGNSFYTTSANRMARDVLPEAVTASDIILALGGNSPPAPKIFDASQDGGILRLLDAEYETAQEELAPAPKTPALSRPRKITACLFGALLLAALVIMGVNFTGFKTFISGGNDAVNIAGNGAGLYVGIMLALAAGAAGLTLTLAYDRETAPSASRGDFAGNSDTPPGSALNTPHTKLPKRTLAAAAMILLAIPLTVYAGSYFFGDRKYYFISLLIILETMLPFALVFESKKPQARELVIIAVLCAIGVAGRAAFFMLPQFRPVVALVIIAGVAFGGESGFLVGAMTGFVSNFFFGQGPWTPYQMFAFGVVGFLAGVLFRKGILRRFPASLAIFGAFVTLIVYGGIMNPASVLMYQNAPTGGMLLAAYLQGIPFDLVHAAATATFLAVISRPMLEKLDRIKQKYGLIE